MFITKVKKNDILIMLNLDQNKKRYAVSYRREHKMTDWFRQNYDVIMRVSSDNQAKKHRDVIHNVLQYAGYKNEKMCSLCHIEEAEHISTGMCSLCHIEEAEHISTGMCSLCHEEA